MYEMVASDWYEEAEEMYEEAQSTYDPRNVMGVLQLHPWHGGSLLAMADLHRSTGDGAYADELVERFIYAMERGWPPAGTLFGSNVFVPFAGYNKLLFVGMMRHVQVLGRRGLHRTALECLKLLYSMNEEDPVGVLACIDFYALRASAHAWLRSMSRSVTQASTMPNIVYSLALASVLERRQGDVGAEEEGITDDEMVKALMMHPAALVRMQEKLGDLDVRLVEWGEVLATPFFAESTGRLANNPTLRKLIDIFVERSHVLWKSPHVQGCMLLAAERVVSLVNASEEMQRESLPMGLSILEWQSVGAGAFPEGAEDAYVHLKVSDFSDAVAAINPEELQAMQGGEDDAEELMMAMAAEMAAGAAGGGRAAPDDLGDAGPLAAFLRTLLPWVHAGVAPTSGDEDDSDDQGA